MSPDGRCKTFDASADGYARGEGCALIVLKRLSDAIAHRDRVLAVIRGSAVNQNGASSALTVPNGQAQQSLMRKALVRAGVTGASLSFFEAHGTGTALGDPIEVESIQAVLSQGREPGNICALGSVKTNAGHLEAAAGVAGLMKVVLSLCHEEIPPSLHLKRLNPRITLDPERFAIPVTRVPWPRRDSPRIAAVSSFGFSGTNAHAIVEEAPLREAAETGLRPWHLLAVSARTEEALTQLLERHQAALQSEPNPADYCYTANAGRSHFTHRMAATGRTAGELRDKLGSSRRASAGRPRVAFLFTGQGSQYPGMGRQLYESQPVFRQVIEECEECLRYILPEPLREVLYGDKGHLLDDTAYTQPALFAVEFGLAQLWRSWGIEPVAVLGHSVGEYVAAAVAGVFSMAEGVRLIGERGRLMQALPEGGAMAAMAGSGERVRRAVVASGGRLSVAAWNGPSNTVISGDAGELDRVERELKDEGVGMRRLRVSHAFHSARMEPAMEPFGERLREVKQNAPRLRWIANLTGEAMSEMPDTGYWLRQLREPVQFEASMRTLKDLSCDTMVEAGPGPVLIGMGRQCWGEDAGTAAWLPSLQKGGDEWRQMLESLGLLYERGCAVDWEGFDRPYPRRRIALPTYPFQRRRFWVKEGAASQARRSAPAIQVEHSHPYLGRRLLLPIESILFESDFSVHSLPLVKDHRIHGLPWTNLVIYLEMAAAAAARLFGIERIMLTNVSVPRGLILPEHGSRTVQLAIDGNAFRIFSWSAASWTLHAQGTIAMAPAPDSPNPTAAAVPAGSREISGARFYREMEAQGVRLGTSCQGLESIWTAGGEVFGKLKPVSAEGGFELPLLWIDSAFQLLSALLPEDGPRDFIFTGLENFQVLHQPDLSEPGICHAVSTNGAESPTGDLRVFDATGKLIVVVKNARLERIGAAIADPSRPVPRSQDPVLEELQSAAPADRAALLASYLIRTLAGTLRRQPGEIDPESPLLGMLDSLMAVELKTRIEADLRIEVPVAAIFEANSIRHLSQHLLDGVVAAKESVDRMIRDLAALPDSEVEAMLRMERGEGDA